MKLSLEDRWRIRTLKAEGHGVSALADAFGVSRRTIFDICATPPSKKR